MPANSVIVLTREQEAHDAQNGWEDDHDSEEDDHVSELPLLSLSTPHTPLPASRTHNTFLPHRIVPSPLPVLSPYPSNFPSSPLEAFSSPIKGRTKVERAASRRAKQKKKRSQKQLASAAVQRSKMKAILQYIRVQGVRFGDFLQYVFNPASYEGNILWHELFAKPGSAAQILDWWAHHYSNSVREEVKDWAVAFVCSTVRKEAANVTSQKFLQTRNVKIDRPLLSSLSFLDLHDTLSTNLAPTSMAILKSLSTSPRASSKHSERRKERTQIVCLVMMSLAHCT